MWFLIAAERKISVELFPSLPYMFKLQKLNSVRTAFTLKRQRQAEKIVFWLVPLKIT